MSKQRILMLLENNPYPRDMRVRQEAQSLLSAGYSVIVISPSAKDLPFHEVVDDVITYRYPAPPEFSGFVGYVLEYGVAMLGMLILSIYISLRHGFDIIHAHNPPDFMVVIAIFFKIFRVKFVFDHHDLAPEMYSTRGGAQFITNILHYFEKLTCQVADHVITTNESYKQIDAERNGVNPEQITVVRNGPVKELLDPVEGDQSVREKAEHIICYLGEIGESDGVDYLIRSLDILRTLRKDWYCIIIGDGPAREEAEQLMHSLNLDSMVDFAGWKRKAEFLPLIHAADIGAEPIPQNDYTNHSTMIKIMEYMASGLPVVAFDLKEHRATAAGAALYATPNDETEFANCLSQLMDDKDKRAAMREEGRNRIQTLMWTSQEEKLLSAYRAVTGE